MPCENTDVWGGFLFESCSASKRKWGEPSSGESREVARAGLCFVSTGGISHSGRFQGAQPSLWLNGDDVCLVGLAHALLHLACRCQPCSAMLVTVKRRQLASWRSVPYCISTSSSDVVSTDACLALGSMKSAELFLVAQWGRCLPRWPSSCTVHQALRGKPGGLMLFMVKRRKPSVRAAFLSSSPSPLPDLAILAPHEELHPRCSLVVTVEGRQRARFAQRALYDLQVKITDW
jgi:hypothetical protein